MATSLGKDGDVVSSTPSIAGHANRMGPRKRAMTVEGELYKWVGAERRSWRKELEARGGSFRLRRSGESGGGTAREHAVIFEEEFK